MRNSYKYFTNLPDYLRFYEILATIFRPQNVKLKTRIFQRQCDISIVLYVPTRFGGHFLDPGPGIPVLFV